MALFEGKKNEVRAKEQSGCVVRTCARDCFSALFAFVCSCVDKDLETGLSVPGSQSPSIATVNDLHMGPAGAGYSNIPVYSNVRADCFS